MSRETTLWRTVIKQAMSDLISKGSSEELCLELEEASTWFNKRNKDFIHVCSLADIDPSYMLIKIEPNLIIAKNKAEKLREYYRNLFQLKKKP